MLLNGWFINLSVVVKADQVKKATLILTKATTVLNGKVNTESLVPETPEWRELSEAISAEGSPLAFL